MADSIDYPELTIRVGDLTGQKLEQKLRAMWQHKRSQVRALVASVSSPSPEFLRLAAEQNDEAMLDVTTSTYRLFAQLGQTVSGDYLDTLARKYEQLVFEGAQGVLLDEWYGFHPYTTWSTTTHANALTLLNEVGYSNDVTRLGVIRAYASRHGAGPFVTQASELEPYLPEHFNTDNAWQHEFRVGYPDMVAARYALEVCGGADELMLTHLDRAAHITQLATAYATGSVPAEMFESDSSGNPVRIVPGGIDELDRQQAITDVLMSCQPVYQRLSAAAGKNASVNAADGLVSAFTEHLALPVTYTSYGPTWADKRALVAC